MQSVIFSIIFYGWGFGKFGRQEPSVIIWYAVGVFISQLLISYYWLKKHKHHVYSHPDQKLDTSDGVVKKNELKKERLEKERVPSQYQ